MSLKIMILRKNTNFSIILQFQIDIKEKDLCSENPNYIKMEFFLNLIRNALYQ